MSDPSTDPKPPCTDCGKPSTGTVFEHISVAGDRRYLCTDCLEEDIDNVFRELCFECRGSGRDHYGDDCEWCDGSGTD